ncbi:MAG: helix-turn-helix transcriptional regulator [Clostridiales bacterium]|nr:helix-turn-helix transcriptional regulator [Clostridiales bacterium]
MEVTNKNVVYSFTAENLTLEILIEKSDYPIKVPSVMISDHTHHYIEILVCRKDSIKINSPDGVITIHEGEAAIIPPNISHRCLNENDVDIWRGISFVLRKYHTPDCQDLYSLIEPFGIGKKIMVIQNIPILFSIIEELTEDHDSTKRIINSLHFIYQLCKISDEYRFSNKYEQSVEVNRDSGFIRMSLLDRIINTEFMKPLTAEEVAQRLNISSRQLARIAKQRYNKTLYRVIIEKRLITAAEMLRTSGMSAERIAMMVGFSSKNTFWKEFRKKYSMTPAEYRSETLFD